MVDAVDTPHWLFIGLYEGKRTEGVNGGVYAGNVVVNVGAVVYDGTGAMMTGDGGEDPPSDIN